MKKFVVRVSEILNRYVIVEAEDNYEAEETAEELCNSGEINLVCEDFFERNVTAVCEASDYDEDTIKEVYRSE